MPRRPHREIEDLGPEPGEEEAVDVEAVEGAETARKNLLPWLEGLLLKNVENEEATFTLHLCRVFADKETRLQQFPFEPGAGENLEEVLDDVLDSAENDAALYTGTTRYAIKVVINGHEKKQNFRLVNVQTGPRGSSIRSPSTELNDSRSLEGVVGQQMRHNECLVDGVVKLATSNDAQKDRYIARLEKRIEMLEAREIDAVPLLAKVHDMTWKKEFAIRDAENEADAKRQAMGMLTQAIPFLASATGLLPGGPPGASPLNVPGFGGAGPGPGVVQASIPQPPEYPILLRMALHVEGLFSALETSPDKLAALQQTLDPMQLMAIAELHRAVAELRELRDGPSRRSPPAPQDPPQQQAPTPNRNGFQPFTQVAGVARPESR